MKIFISFLALMLTMIPRIFDDTLERENERNWKFWILRMENAVVM
jgi:hypothetical protein